MINCCGDDFQKKGVIALFYQIWQTCEIQRHCPIKYTPQFNQYLHSNCGFTIPDIGICLICAGIHKRSSDI